MLLMMLRIYLGTSVCIMLISYFQHSFEEPVACQQLFSQYDGQRLPGQLQSL